MKKFKIFFISFFVLCFVCVCLISQTFLLSQSLKICESITIEKSNFKNVKTNNRVSSEEYASRGWDKNIFKWSDNRSYLVDEDYIGAKDLARYTSDYMCW